MPETPLRRGMCDCVALSSGGCPLHCFPARLPRPIFVFARPPCRHGCISRGTLFPQPRPSPNWIEMPKTPQFYHDMIRLDTEALQIYIIRYDDQSIVVHVLSMTLIRPQHPKQHTCCPPFPRKRVFHDICFARLI